MFLRVGEASTNSGFSPAFLSGLDLRRSYYAWPVPPCSGLEHRWSGERNEPVVNSDKHDFWPTGEQALPFEWKKKVF